LCKSCATESAPGYHLTYFDEIWNLPEACRHIPVLVAVDNSDLLYPKTSAALRVCTQRRVFGTDEEVKVFYGQCTFVITCVFLNIMK